MATSSIDAQETCRTMLKILSDKKHVLFTTRGNESIRLSMLAVSRLGRYIVLFQEEGGWLTYERYIKQAGLEPLRLVTDDGLIHVQELDRFDTDAALLLNSLAGYVAMHDMDDIFSRCVKNNIFLVNDVSGSIGTSQAKLGDVIIGSFGKAKPVDLGKGGFVASDDKEFLDALNEDFDEEPELDYEQLQRVLKDLERRREFLIARTKKIKKDLQKKDIVHREEDSLNVIVRFNDEKEKEELISYCDTNKFEYTLCPREIRILDDAVSIEVKRLPTPKE